MQVIPVSGLLLRRLHKLPAFKVLLAIVILWLLAFEYCRLRYWRDPHSAFFDDSHVYEWKYSLYREHEGRHLISIHSAPIDPPETTKAGSNPLICAAFATVKRGTDDYFDASIGSLLEGLDPRERRALHLNVLFAGTDPTRHPSWGQKWVERLADSTGSYNVSESQFEHLRELEDVGNFYEKGVFDYIYALRSCQNTNAPYIAIFEDDIILAEGWMANTVKGLMDINHSPIKDPWVYLRLFYTETSLSWTESYFAYRNMPLIFFSSVVFVFTALMVARRFRVVGHSYLDYPMLGVICLVAVPAFVALTYMIGKYSLMPMQGVVEMNSFGCCTQGLVFPTERVDGLIDYLQERKAGQTDAMIEDYAAQTHLTRYALAPQQLQHVGLKSSRGNLAINTQSTWAFWFEENDPKTLRKEHERLLRDADVGWALDEHG